MAYGLDSKPIASEAQARNEAPRTVQKSMPIAKKSESNVVSLKLKIF